MEGGTGAGSAVSEPPAQPATLAEIGITKKQSSVAQKLADIPKEEFQERVAVAKASGGKLSTGKVLNPTPKPAGRDVRSDGRRKGVVREIKTERELADVLLFMRWQHRLGSGVTPLRVLAFLVHAAAVTVCLFLFLPGWMLAAIAAVFSIFAIIDLVHHLRAR